MTHIHMDFWTPDPTADPAVFKVKLVDIGADGAFGGGDDVEHELILNAASTPPLATGTWVSFDIPLSDFTGLTTKGAIAQLIISGNPNTVFLKGFTLEGMGRRSGAAKEYTRYIEIDTQSKQAQYAYQRLQDWGYLKPKKKKKK